MKLIALTQGQFAMVDDEDFDRINEHKWCYDDGYAMRAIYGNPKGSRRTIRMHREVMRAEPWQEVDHRDLYKGNNQKYNLRLCTRSDNSKNRAISKANSSGAKGVYFQKSAQKYQATIGYNGTKLYLGLFDTVEEASAVYQIAALKYHGEFARW